MKRIILAIIVATVIALTCHIYLHGWVTQITHKALASSHIVSSSHYGHLIVFFAYVTLLIPVTVIALLYYFVGHIIPVRNKIARGIILGVILLLITGDFIRQPFMNVLVGVPIWVAMLQQLQTLIYRFAVTISIALIVHPKKEK